MRYHTYTGTSNSYGKSSISYITFMGDRFINRDSKLMEEKRPIHEVEVEAILYSIETLVESSKIREKDTILIYTESSPAINILNKAISYKNKDIKSIKELRSDNPYILCLNRTIDRISRIQQEVIPVKVKKDVTRKNPNSLADNMCNANFNILGGD